MSRDKESIQIKKKQQLQKYDLKKNRISFKQFQQCYQQHVQVQKQKKKSQQQSLSKLSSKNIKPTLQQMNKQNQPNQSNNQLKVFFNNNQQNQNQIENQKQSTESQTQPITFNRSVNIKSLYASPKASSMNFMKSINLASNKSKQILHGNKPMGGNLSSNTKINNQKVYNGQSKRNNVSINVNVKSNNNSQHNGQRKLSKENNQLQVQKLQSNHMSKNSSLSQMNTFDPFEGSLTSLGSQKLLKYQNPSFFQSTQFITQQVNYLATQLQFLNQFIKQIEPTSEINQPVKTSNVTYKIKLLSQIKNKLHKYQQNSVINEKNPLKQLFTNIIELLSNYENDLKKLSTLPNQQPTPKGKALEIVIDQNNTIDYENRFKRQDSKKKTVKLSKSRRTNQQTLHTESIVHPFESSQFSLLNTSKITDISRPSSQNKEKSGYYNEIENIINSKILHQSVDKNENVKPNVFKDQSQSKMKVLIKGSKKTINNPIITKGISIKGVEGKSDNLSQQSQTKNKVKSVTKTINLIANPKPQVSQRVPQKSSNFTQKSKTVTMKDILQKNKHKNSLQVQDPSKNLQSQNIQSNKNNFFTDIRQSFGSHNESIFELEYLENYSSQNHNFPIHTEQMYNNMHYKLTIQTGNNINWKQNKYSNKLFM